MLYIIEIDISLLEIVLSGRGLSKIMSQRKELHQQSAEQKMAAIQKNPYANCLQEPFEFEDHKSFSNFIVEHEEMFDSIEAEFKNEKSGSRCTGVAETRSKRSKKN